MTVVEVDRLFLETLDDLERRAGALDEYEVLMSAALLRKLLMDDTPLVDRVNRERRLRLRFRINASSKYEQVVLGMSPSVWSLGDAIDPETCPPPGMRAPFDATRDELLSRPVLLVHGEVFTVKHLIEQLAHIEGAVHSGSPKTHREEVLQQIERRLYVGGLPAGVRQMRSIARVVLRGLAPLREAVGSDA